MSIERVHGGHIGGARQYTDFPLGNKFYFHANIFYFWLLEHGRRENTL